MSFASETKKELTTLETKDCCAKAELSALIRMNGSLSFSNRLLIVNIQTENAAIARRIYILIKNILRELKILGEGFTFIHNIEESLIKKKCCKRSYLRGAFLAGGSVNNPETSSYHLEIFSLYKEHNDSLCEHMNDFGLNSKTLERKNGYITYLKEAEKITEFLNIIGAHNALLRFEDVRIVRDMRN